MFATKAFVSNKGSQRRIQFLFKADNKPQNVEITAGGAQRAAMFHN